MKNISHLKKNKLQNNASVRSSSQNSTRGVIGELLPGDGQTFTSLTRLPKPRLFLPESWTVVTNYSIKDWFATSTTVPTFTYVTVQLSQSPLNSSFIAIFDQYMIDDAEVYILPQTTVAANPNQCGLLSSVIDVDDSTTLGSTSAADGYSSVVTSESTQGHYRHFIPHVALAAYSGAFTSYANRRFQWIDCASNTVAHYGVKLASTVTAAIVTYDLRVRFRIHFRNVH